MRCWKAGCVGRWHNRRGRNEHRHEHRHEFGKNRYYETSSGKSAFDDYREETLKRLEDEQIEFESFLERLRHAKDKAEFDQFMDDRSAPTEGREKPEGAADNPTN